MKVAACTAFASLMLLTGSAHAAEPLASEGSQAASSAAPTRSTDSVAGAPMGTAGVRVYRDPVTGEWVDTPVTPEQREQAESLNLPAPDYSKVTLEPRADGSVIAHSNGQFESSSTIQFDDDGKARTGCSQTGPHADHAHALKNAEPRP